MPTTYAHYRFGRDVYKHLPQRIQEMVRSHGGLYNIGLHGPDLLFYFKVFQKNPVNQTGFAMHDRPGKEFFEQAALVMQKKSPRRIRKNSLRQSSRAKAGKPRPSAFVSYVTSAKYAYIFGFLCHFALDSNCHPYVENMVRETGISHSEIEAELDRDLMLHDGLNPMTCRPTPHLRARLFYGRIISRFFPDITVRQILTSIRSMRLCCNLLAPSGKKLRFIARFLMKGSHLPKAVQEMVIKEQPDPKCAPITRELERRYQKAIPMAAELIVNFMEHVEEGTPLDKRFNHTFGEM